MTADIEKIAKQFHESYERLAPSFGYKTREESAVPWENVPPNNKALMRAVVEDLMGRGYLGGVWQDVSTAQKNGKKMWLSDGKYVSCGFYVDQYNADFENGFYTDGETSDESEGGHGIYYTYVPLKPQPIYCMQIIKPVVQKDEV